MKTTIDPYTKKYIKLIKAAEANWSDETLAEIVNKIYADGFEDGAEAKEN